MRLAVVMSLLLAAPAPFATDAMAQSGAPIDMCAVTSAGYSGELYDNGWLDKLPGRINDGIVTCESQSMRRLGIAGGRTYFYWQADFGEIREGYIDPVNHLVGQVGEVAADGTMQVVYRVSSDTETAIDVNLIERDGAAFLSLTDPIARVWRRDADGFVPMHTGFDVYELAEDVGQKGLPDGYVGVEHPDGIYRVDFDPATLSVNLPVAVASEIFPRVYADPDYDRPITLRFPMRYQSGAVATLGDPEMIEPEYVDRGRIGETPASVVVPAETKMCDIYAWVQDNDPAGVTVRATPDTKGQAIAVLPSAHSIEDAYTPGAELRVVGVKDGWFLIERAKHPTAMYGDDDRAGPGTGSATVRQAFAGRGWIHGSRLATGIQLGRSLRASADPKSKPVFDLKIDSESGETWVSVDGFKNCEGDAIELTAKRSIDGVEGTGWIGGDDASQLCSNQVTTCS